MNHLAHSRPVMKLIPVIVASIVYVVGPCWAGFLENTRQATEHGDASAQYLLGYMYEKGQGVPRDYVAAYMWSFLAAVHGDETARKALDHVESMITPEQRSEAQKLAREWKPTDVAPRESASVKREKD